jgi:hypothetical protein
VAINITIAVGHGSECDCTVVTIMITAGGSTTRAGVSVVSGYSYGFVFERPDQVAEADANALFHRATDPVTKPIQANCGCSILDFLKRAVFGDPTIPQPAPTPQPNPAAGIAAAKQVGGAVGALRGQFAAEAVGAGAGLALEALDAPWPPLTPHPPVSHPPALGTEALNLFNKYHISNPLSSPFLPR